MISAVTGYLRARSKTLSIVEASGGLFSVLQGQMRKR
jgi:hypothetical protein